MDTSAAMNKGIGKQIVPTVIILIGNCLLRVIWVMAVRSLFPGSPETPNNIYYLYLSYPVTCTLSFIGNGIYYLIIRKKLLSGRLDIRI
jgi:Na+-driven multidrug efflux pump